MPIKDQHRNVLRRGLDRGPATKGSKAQARGCQQAPGHGMSLAHKLILALAVGARSLDRPIGLERRLLQARYLEAGSLSPWRRVPAQRASCKPVRRLLPRYS